MNLVLDRSLAFGYTSGLQIARRVTENWMEQNMFCPVCGHWKVRRFENNTPVGDFYCEQCNEEFELKSKQGNHDQIGNTIDDGAYGTMIERISSLHNPHLFVMLHENWTVNTLLMVPKFLFSPQIIKKRPPLGPHARRAGWVGCRISIGEIPDSGKIHIIQEGRPTPVRKVVSQYQRTLSLKTGRVNTRGWLFDVLRCIEHISSDIFTITDVYGFTDILKRQYPDNQFVRPKIRQQLQRLRDRGFISFLGNGVYKKVLPLIQEPVA